MNRDYKHQESLSNNVIHYLQESEIPLWSELIEIIQQVSQANPYEVCRKKKNSGSANRTESAIYHLMWDEQCGINFPLLYVSSIYLYYYAVKNNCDTFLFATRDGCHWFKIFKKLFPHTNAHYFHCSRNMFEKATEQRNAHYKSYVKSLLKTEVDRAIFIDIHGTGKRAFTYFEKQFRMVPYYFLISATMKNYGEFPTISRKYYKQKKFLNLIFDARGSPIEMLNYDIQGTLQNYTEAGAVRDELEYPMNRLEAYHTCIDYSVDQIQTADTDQVIAKFDLHDCSVLLKKIYRVIQDNKPAISLYIEHPSRHEQTVDVHDKQFQKEKKKKKAEKQLKKQAEKDNQSHDDTH